MTEVIYKIFYHTPVEGIEKEIEGRIKRKIYEVLKTDLNLSGYHVTKFNVNENNGIN